LSRTEAVYPKYPPQPVVRCDGYQRKQAGKGGLTDPATGGTGKEFRAVPHLHRLSLRQFAERFAVCRLEKDSPIPAWAASNDFLSITRTADELSIVCLERAVPEGLRCERGWRCLRIAGALDFSAIGVVASLVLPLADAEISVFVVSTFDTDYLLVKENDLARATEALRAAGHDVG
jgi:hypothetical protein